MIRFEILFSKEDTQQISSLFLIKDLVFHAQVCSMN